MKGLSAQNSVALCQGYNSREEMIELTGVDPDTVDDDDESTWPESKVVRTITIEQLAHGGWTVREGDKLCDKLGWDEMLGHFAAMTMLDKFSKAPRQVEGIYRMQTREERLAEHRARVELIKQREARQQ